MQSLIYEIFTSSLMIFLVCFIGFILLSRWALLELKAYRSYLLGWLVGLIVMISVGAVLPDAPVDPDAAPPTITLFQVVIAILAGTLLGTLHMVFTAMQRDSYLSNSLRVAGLTFIGVLVNFFVIIGSPVVQRMLGLFVLTLFSFILLSQIFQRSATTEPAVDDSDGDYAPVSSERMSRRRRLREIREKRT